MIPAIWKNAKNLLWIALLASFTLACGRNEGRNNPEDGLEVTRDSSAYNGKDSVKNDPRQGKGEGELGTQYPPGGN